MSHVYFALSWRLVNYDERGHYTRTELRQAEELRLFGKVVGWTSVIDEWLGS